MRELQEWMFGAITAPEPPSEEAVIARLTDSERIEIYRGMYELRMIEALGNDYPAIAAWLGEHDFGHLVADYIAVHPSASYTLNRLGDHLPEFIAEGRHHAEPRPVLRDLARLELAMTEVFDEAEVPLLSEEGIAAIGPETRLRLIPALRLLALEYPVNALFQAYRDDEEMVIPDAAPGWLAVHRRDYSVMRMPLTESAFDFLTILRDGATLGDACEAVMPTQDELFAWFRDWSAAGLFGDPE